MEIELLKTFLEVARVRHFGKAAANLYVTQSAVSSRIRLLEQQVGRPLFLRARNNIQLTIYGEKLIDHAEKVLKAWGIACASLAIEEESRPSFAIGGVSSLWESNLLPLLQGVYQRMQGYDLYAEVDCHDNLIKKLLERQLDICFSFDSLPISALVSEKVAEIELLMLCPTPDIDLPAALKLSHVMIDWGKNLTVQYKKIEKSLPNPTLRTNSAQLGLDFFLNNGGTIFLPKSFVATLLKKKKIFTVQGSDPYLCPVYAHFSRSDENEEVLWNVLKFFKKIIDDRKESSVSIASQSPLCKRVRSRKQSTQVQTVGCPSPQV